MVTRLLTTLLAGAALMTMGGCATPPDDPDGRAMYDEANDPAEPTNRVIFAGNQFLDRAILKPVARAYTTYLPDTVQHSIHNFASNFGEPVVLVNDLLQGNVTRAWVTTQRFAANTTIGAGGLFDPATDWGLPYHTADFGQTFGVWGIGTGPSVQLPLFNFTNVRDTVGLVVSAVANPLSFVPGSTATDLRIADSGLSLVDRRAELLPATDSLEKSSLDYYGALRSVTAHRRAALVEEGKAGLATKPPKEDFGAQTQTRREDHGDTVSLAERTD